MQQIKSLKTTEKIIKRLAVINDSLDTTFQAKENHKQLTFQIMILNEQMKLLVEYQRKQENFQHIKRILQLKDMAGDQNADLDEDTKQLVQSFIEEDSSCDVTAPNQIDSIINGSGKTNDLLLLKLEQIRLQSEEKSSILFNDQDTNAEKIDDIHRQIQDSIVENQKFQQITSHWNKLNNEDCTGTEN